MSTFGEEINFKVFNRLNEIERKKIEKQIDENRPTQIYRSFPANKILEEKTAIRYLEKETGLNEGIIKKSIDNLLKSERFVSAYDTKQRRHLRKNPYKPL